MSVLQTGIGPEKGFYPYAIDQSLRFNDDDSAYLERTPATAGNRKTWTWSGWVKRGNLGSVQGIFEAKHTKDDQTSLGFETSDKLLFTDRPSNVRNIDLRTTQVFRDVGAWYHIVVTVDTTQSTAADRVSLYVNGEEVTNFDTPSYPSQNYDTAYWNNTNNHRLGYQQGNSANHFDGYLAEINFIDGQALDPTSFGEFKSGVWVAKEYTGTYGTNGFYLPFENGLGNDESGNGNDWTPNNLAATDIVLDSPTNNFATWNSIRTPAEYKEGNLFGFEYSDGNYMNDFSSIALPSSGKWYFEINHTHDGRAKAFGVSSTLLPDEFTTDADCYVLAFNFDGSVRRNDSNSTHTGSWFNAGTYVLSTAIDMDAGTIKLFVDNILIYSDSLPSNYNEQNLFFVMRDGSGGSTSSASTIANFGQDSSFAGNETAQGNTDENGIGDFYYTPPAGFLALCTANLPEPAISPADDESPSDYFNTVLWTGDGTSSREITGVEFQPDWVWIKKRNAAFDHNLFDAVRGAGKGLESSTTADEFTVSDRLNAFNSDGFTVGNSGAVNNNLDTYVAWNWKAGGAGVTNTDGSITSTVSVSTESGFSIVSYTGDASTNATVGHGLSSAPAFVIVKNRDQADDWKVGHQSLTAPSMLTLNQTYSVGNSSWVTPTSSVIGVATASDQYLNQNNEDYIAYCFAELEGYSKFGSYTGNGSSDGPFVYTGFRPAFVMIKRTDSTQNWPIVDTSRDTYNIANKRLFSNLSSADDTGIPNYLDLLSNGFKCRDGNVSYNASGGTYIYMAFAENPFKYSLAR